MKNKKIILEEINQIQYLFGYKRGVVISEQNNQSVNNYKKDIATNMKLIDAAWYFTLLGDNKTEEAKYFYDSKNCGEDCKANIKKVEDAYLADNKPNRVDFESSEKELDKAPATTSNAPQLPQGDKDNMTKLEDVKQDLQAWLGGKPKDAILDDFGVPNLFYGYGESMDRESAKSNARTDAEKKAKNAGVQKTAGGLEQAAALTQSGENYISRKIFYFPS